MIEPQYRSAQLGVVVGVDHEPGTRAAVDFAVEEACARGLPLTLAHAVGPPARTRPRALGDVGEQLDAGQRLVRSLRRQLPADAARRTTSVVELTEPADLLLDLARTAELVVVGHRGVSPPQGLFGRSVVDPLGSGAGCPVVLVPRDWAPAAGRGRPVVVAVDSEAPGRRVLDEAFLGARRTGADLVVLQLARRVLEGDETVAAAVADRRHRGLDVHVQVSAAGEDARSVAPAAALLVVGRTDPALWLGRRNRSVVAAVLARARCPVMVTDETPFHLGFAAVS